MAVTDPATPGFSLCWGESRVVNSEAYGWWGEVISSGCMTTRLGMGR